MCDSDCKLYALCTEQCSVQQYGTVCCHNTALSEGLCLAFRLAVISRGPVGTGEWNAARRQIQGSLCCVIYSDTSAKE